MIEGRDSIAPHYNSIIIKGEEVGEDILIMIDNGAIRSFIDLGFVMRNNLPTKIMEGVYVTNANGHYTLCDQKVQFSIKMVNHIIKYEFYFFPQVGLQQVMLGVQWMYPLGDINSNSQLQEVSFSFKEKKVIIKGVEVGHGQHLVVTQNLDLHTSMIFKRATLDYTTKGNMLGPKRKLEFVNFCINHDEYKEDKEEYVATTSVSNCLGKSNLEGENCNIPNFLVFSPHHH